MNLRYFFIIINIMIMVCFIIIKKYVSHDIGNKVLLKFTLSREKYFSCWPYFLIKNKLRNNKLF